MLRDLILKGYMHAIAEIVIPPTETVEKSIAQVMDYFKDDDAEQAEWWDFYVIGGRFSGHKLEASLDPKHLERFYAWLKEEHITVSGLQCGKQELSPASQIPKVDAMWREMFPGKGETCILFAHSNDQYGRSGIYGWDVCKVLEIPAALSCERLIVAGPHWDTKEHPHDIEPKRMLATEFWNRVEHQKTGFDGLVKPALETIRADDKSYKHVAVTDDWLVVTVDYHN